MRYSEARCCRRRNRLTSILPLWGIQSKQTSPVCSSHLAETREHYYLRTSCPRVNPLPGGGNRRIAVLRLFSLISLQHQEMFLGKFSHFPLFTCGSIRAAGLMNAISSSSSSSSSSPSSSSSSSSSSVQNRYLSRNLSSSLQFSRIINIFLINSIFSF